MTMKIVAYATGLAAILGAGSIVLTGLGNADGMTYLFAAIVVFMLGKVL